ncbi:MAG TPA: hypothetical protein VLD61_05645, partial [Methylomirabilota bacterium]|nr:hypothetical protein [Methylomirabilota bacterium]
LVNRAQSGHALVSGYHAVHAPGGGTFGLFTVSEFPTEAISLVAGVLRLNLWLLGWPVSLIFCVLAHRSRRTGLLWAMVAMALLYRLVSPKAGVASTGPQYLHEVVPLLALLTADGLGRLVTGGWLGRDGRAALRRATALVLAGTVVGATMFLPVALRNLRRTAEAQLVLPRMVAARKLANAVVFHEYAVPPDFLTSWASFPRHNAPALDDDVLFVRFLPPPVPPEDHLRLWREHFPGRTAWYFGYPDGRPRLLPLEVYVRSRVLQAAAPTPGALSPLAPGDAPRRR